MFFCTACSVLTERQGPEGEQGEQGRACWDRNGNGICDLDQDDKNGDGACNTEDCVGPPGPQGEQGPEGEPGPPGFSCWDINQSRTCEPEEEDKNSDGQCSALDCIGPQGPQGETGPPGGTTLNYANYITVAMSGADFYSIQDAIDSIEDAGPDNPYLIWVAPGKYDEDLILKPYVHIRGASKNSTIISSTSTTDHPPTSASILAASNSSVADLTVKNTGTEGSRAIGILVNDGCLSFELNRVHLEIFGGGNSTVGIYAYGGTTRILDSYIAAHDGTQNSKGIIVGATANFEVFNTEIFTEGPGDNKSIHSSGSIILRNTWAHAASGLPEDGLKNEDGATADASGSVFTEKGCPNTQNLLNLGFCIWLYCENGRTLSYFDAADRCREQGGRLCTLAEVSAAQAAGAQWCSWAWVADRVNDSTAYRAFPMQEFHNNCGGPGLVKDTAGMGTQQCANCCK